MKCKSCPALRCTGYEYPEEYCSVGGDDECGWEWADGEPGCKLHPATERKRLLENEEHEAHMYDGIIEWAQEQQNKEIAMVRAIKEELKHYRSGELHLCFEKNGRYYKASLDGSGIGELAANIVMTYEKILEEGGEEDGDSNWL